MNWQLYLSVGGILLFALFFLGVPIFLSFLAIIVLGIAVIIGPAGFGLLVNSIFETTTTTTMASIPLFILLGEILFRSGTMDVVFTSLDKLIGKIRGRQYVMVVALSAAFGSMIGSAMAVSAMLGRAVIPDMLKRGCDPQLSAGSVLGGACLAPIIPPSILAIIIGSIADVSIARLLVAGILPGVFFAILFLIYIMVIVRVFPDKAPKSPETLVKTRIGEKLWAVVRVLPFLIIIFMVMGFILLGIATPSESAATGVVGAILTAAFYRKLSLRMLFRAFVGTAVISGGILAIMAMSTMFTQLLAFTGSTQALVGIALGFKLDPFWMLMVMMVVPFVLCMFIDEIAIMLIMIPLFDPIVKALEFDPVWFWFLFLVNMALGSIMPPVGYALFTFNSVVPQIPLSHLYVAALPFVCLIILGMGFMIAFPQIVTFLPGRLG